jgi:hypothetical protein
MASRAEQLGRHPWLAIAGMKKMTGDPRLYLNSSGGWSSPDSTINVMEFVAGAAISLGEALFILPDGAAAPADHMYLDQRGRYCGVALAAAGAGETVYAQMYGLMAYHLPVLVAGKAVFVGQNGELTQNYPTDGYRQKVGKALNDQTIMLVPGPCIVTAAQSSALPWPGGANGGVDSLEWATLPDLRAGIASRMAVAPDVLAARLRELIDQYGVTDERIATLAEVQNGTGKLVTGNVLRQYFVGAASGVEFASTAEIEAGLVANKAMSPLAFAPVYAALRAGGGGSVQFADPTETIAGLANDKAVTPFGLDSFRNVLIDQVRALIDAGGGGGGGTDIPKATVAEILAGAAVDKYVAPFEWRAAVDAVLAAYTPGGAGAGYYSGTITGDGVETEFEIEHDLGVAAPFVAVYAADGTEVAGYGVAVSTNDVVRVVFPAAPVDGTVYTVAVAGGMSGGGGATIPFANDAEFLAGSAGKVATIIQIKAYADSVGGGGGGSIPQAVENRIAALELAAQSAPVLATRAEVMNGVSNPLKVANVTDMRDYVAASGGGGGVTPGAVASLQELIDGESNTAVVTPAGLHYVIGLRSMLRTDANGNYYIAGMNDA